MSKFINEFVSNIPKNEIIKDSDVVNINSLYKNFIIKRDIVVTDEIYSLKNDFVNYYECFSFIPFRNEIQNFVNDKLENIDMNEYVGITEILVGYIRKTEKFVNEYNDKRIELLENISYTMYI